MIICRRRRCEVFCCNGKTQFWGTCSRPRRQEVGSVSPRPRTAKGSDLCGQMTVYGSGACGAVFGCGSKGLFCGDDRRREYFAKTGYSIRGGEGGGGRRRHEGIVRERVTREEECTEWLYIYIYIYMYVREEKRERWCGEETVDGTMPRMCN